ncbi:MAG: glutathione-disulfide reductase [Alphaproteobacteria bacterium]
MSNFDYDLFVIGAGSAGVRAARLAGAMGKKVAIAEGDKVGGTCVIRGCVPKKLMVYAAQYAHYFQDSKGYGWQVDKPNFNWDNLKQARDAEVERLSNLYINTLKNNHVELIKGRAKFTSLHKLLVGEKSYSAKNILIATGSKAFMPLIDGIEYAITSDEIFHLAQLPKKLAITGGGFIALEFAGIFNALGCEVHLIYRGDKFLRGFDNDLRHIITQEQAKSGIKLHLATQITQIQKQADNSKNIHLDNGDKIIADDILFALGRKPNIDDLGLSDIDIKLQDGFIKVDADFRTSQAHIGAVGDIINTPALTPVALREAAAWISAIYNNKHLDINYEFLPSAVFAQPNVATAGYSEEAANKKFGSHDIDVYTTHFRPMIHTLSKRDTKVFLKLVVQKSSDKVLGVHMVGHDAGEVVQGLAIALSAGATKANFDYTIGIHPSVAEDFTFMQTKKS